jgi:hypothetical protein
VSLWDLRQAIEQNISVWEYVALLVVVLGVAWLRSAYGRRK